MSLSSTVVLCCSSCRAKLVDLDLGCAVPVIAALKAASCPGTGALPAPQLQMAISYKVSCLRFVVELSFCVQVMLGMRG